MSIKTIFENLDYGMAPESDEQATRWLTQHQAKFNHFIAGKWQSPASGNYFNTIQPRNGEQLAQLANGDQQDVDLAVKAANKALTAWQKLSGFERAKYLYALARKVQKHARLFAVLERLDNGKPIRETRDIDIPLVVRHLYYHAGCAQNRDSLVAGYEPVGVVGQIIPWNFPLLMLAWKVAPALAMGNTLVLKPAEFTSLTAILFAQLIAEIGLPDGVFNLVLGDAKAGQALVEHSDVSKIAFTGSTEVGKLIRRATAGSGKKLSLELGGKSAFIVFDDADIDSAIEGLVDAIWFNQGQVCCAGSRLLVQENIADTFYRRLKQRMDKLITGDSLEKGIDIGAIIDQTQLNKITELVQSGVAQGAEIYQPAFSTPDQSGCFYPPTLLTEVEPANTLAQEEIFGPVLVAMTFRTPSEAVQLANNSRYGLAASIWSENINLALDVAPKIKAGSIWINSTNFFDASCGFGGYRESGFGREGGLEGLYEYVVPAWYKTLTNKQPASKKAAKTTETTISIDRTAKLYIGGKQTRPDSGYSIAINSISGQLLTEVPDGSRKDIRNAVEAAHAGASWSQTSAHNRAQVLFYLAENLAARAEHFAKLVCQLTGFTTKEADTHVATAIERIFLYAGLADKYDGQIHNPPQRVVTLAMKEPVGTIGIVAPEDGGLVSLVSTLLPALAMGNRVILVPSLSQSPLATELYQLLDTSDVPAGAVNIVTGDRESLAECLAKHYDLEGLWYWGSAEGSANIEKFAADSMKRTWVNYGKVYNWSNPEIALSSEFLRRATEIKNIWVPYGI